MNKKYYTKHGPHLNNVGKEWLARSIANLINMFAYNNNKVEPIIVLHWKEESINITNINIKRNAEDRSTIVQASPDQFHPR